MCSAVKWSVHTTSPNVCFEELALQASFLKIRQCSGIDFAVVVIGCFKLNEHVSLSFIVANA